MARSPEARAPKRPRTAPSGAAEGAPPRAWSDHIRGQLEAEIDKLRPLPGARHALVLIGENAIVPRGRSSMQGFVIVDPDGRPRTVLRHGRTSPFRLADLAAELRERFPMLFEPGTVIGEAAPSGTAPVATRTVAPDEAEPGRVGGSDGGRRDPSVIETAGAHGAESHRIGGPDLLPRTTLFRPTHWVYAGLLLSAGAVLAYVFAGSGARTGGAPAAQADGGQGARRSWLNRPDLLLPPQRLPRLLPSFLPLRRRRSVRRSSPVSRRWSIPRPCGSSAGSSGSSAWSGIAGRMPRISRVTSLRAPSSANRSPGWTGTGAGSAGAISPRWFSTTVAAGRPPMRRRSCGRPRRRRAPTASVSGRSGDASGPSPPGAEGRPSAQVRPQSRHPAWIGGPKAARRLRVRSYACRRS